ncbi:MAG: hypothetical protein GMKNLPBB_01665 [Myxococcota bacterium]|nr:hypothetical protein [Myxococcota bacterium]
MLQRDHIIETLQRAVRNSGAGQAQATWIGGVRGVHRFANSAVQQSIHENAAVIYLRVVDGARIGTATVSRLDPDDLDRGFARALAFARAQQPLPYEVRLPGPQKTRSLNTWVEATAASTPGDRAAELHRIFSAVNQHGMSAAGLLLHSLSGFAVVNSNGVECWQPGTSVHLKLFAIDGRASGYASFCSRDIGAFDFPDLAQRAIGKCARSRNPADIEVGDYDVVIEPEAVAESLEWIASTAFGARAVEDGASFLEGREGELITGENISIADDALDDSIGLAAAFDFEGTPCERVDLIKNGRAGRPAHDIQSAARMGTRSTGHASPPNDFGNDPVPTHLTMASGAETLESLIAKVEKGVYITRFHYVNGLLDTRKALQTGMTRDGTFLIENGKLTRGIGNLRWTQGMLEAFSRVDGITRERATIPGWWSELNATVVPGLLIRRFHFTGRQGA